MPVVTIEAPPGASLDAKRVMMKKLTETLKEVYPLTETLIFLHETGLENVSLNGVLQSENPGRAEAFRKIKDAQQS
jgi:phenylpyruvate tautomerase PptA (4-oxalocrotonate tautomerase family)